MQDIANTLIAVAYFAIPTALIPLVQVAKTELRTNLLLLAAFVFSCGVGHLADGFDIPFLMHWHWVTTVISWVFLAALVSNRAKLLEVYQSFELLEVSWQQSIVAKMLFKEVDNDLKVLKLNPKAQEITQRMIDVDDFLCQKLPNHREIAYPLNEPLIDIYLGVDEPKVLEFKYSDGKIDGWFLNVCVKLYENIIYMSFIDITAIKEAALKDSLTGLYNRRILENEDGRWGCCLYLDLDKFKAVNDTRGHAVGDKVLIEVGKVLEKIAKEHNGLSIREGGDEFLVLLNHDECLRIATQCLEQIKAIKLDSEKPLISASIGVACGAIDCFLECERQLDRVILAAETASRKAKSNKKTDLPKDRIVVWDSQIAKEHQGDYSIEFYLRSEGLHDQLWLAYQPIVNMITGEILGAEALLRWQSPTLGFVPPSKFIPVAESSGLIYGLSEWVLHNAIAQLGHWQKLKPSLSVSVNISPIELEDELFVANVAKLIGKYQVSIGSLGIEVTERGIYENLDRYLNSLKELREANITLKVDDFGTGQSGLSQLLQFPFQEIKIDRCFVPTDASDVKRITICQTIFELSQALNFSTIVEGIETEWQRDLLVDLGFTVGQGYWFYKPMHKGKFEELLQ